MQKSVIGMRKNNKGFTLIEILIVLVIMGITFSFALIAFGDFGESRRILFSVEQLVNKIHLAQQQAILESSTFGLSIDNSGYQFFQLENNAQWKACFYKGIFKMTYFPQNTQLTLKTNRQAPAGTPTIVINSSGDITPFSLTVGNTREPNIALLIGKRNGDLKVNSKNNSESQ